MELNQSPYPWNRWQTSQVYLWTRSRKSYPYPSPDPKTPLCAQGWRIDTDCNSFIQVLEWSRIMLNHLSSLNMYIWGLQKREQERQTVIETTHLKQRGLAKYLVIMETIPSNARITLRHSVKPLFFTLCSLLISRVSCSG